MNVDQKGVMNLEGRGVSHVCLTARLRALTER